MVAIDADFGALFDGLTISLILFGVTCGQAIFYFRTYRDDPLHLKALVGATWTMDTFHTVLIVHCIWHYLVSKISPMALQTANWSIITQIIPTEIIAFTVDCFFLLRIWTLSGRNRKPLVLLILTVLACAVSIAYVVKCYRFPVFVEATKQEWLLGLFSSLRMVVDLGIAFSMCYLLYRRKEEASFPGSRSLLRNLIQFTVATGLLTSFVTTTYIVSAFVMPKNMVYIGIYFVHGKVYFNSMLAALNSRGALRERAHGLVYDDTLSHELSNDLSKDALYSQP